MQKGLVEYGTTPKYEGTTPSKAPTDEFDYVFAGWKPVINPVTKDSTYVATYTAIERDKGTDSDDGDKKDEGKKDDGKKESKSDETAAPSKKASSSKDEKANTISKLGEEDASLFAGVMAVISLGCVGIVLRRREQ